MMYEKISDEFKRQEKVNKLKKKILADIDKRINECKQELHSDTILDEDYSFWIYRCYYLLELKKYIEDEYTFMRWRNEYEDQDIRIYIINDRDLNIWMQEDYSFVDNYLFNLEFNTEGMENKYYDHMLLNDQNFGHDFTSSSDVIRYEKSLKHKKELKIN